MSNQTNEETELFRYYCYVPSSPVNLYSTDEPIAEEFKYIFNGNLSEDSERDQEPAGFKDIHLKIHQLAAIREMKKLESSDYRWYPTANVGFLTDQVGSGKSFTMLGHLMGNPYYEYRHINKTELPHHSSFAGVELEIENWIRSNLLVVSHTIINQWKGYLMKTNLNFTVIERKTQFPNKDALQEYKEKIENENIQVILLKANLYNDFIEIFIGDMPEEEHIHYAYDSPKYRKNAELIEAIRNKTRVNMDVYRKSLETKISSIRKLVNDWGRLNLVTDRVLLAVRDSITVQDAVNTLRDSLNELENIPVINNYKDVIDVVQPFVDQNMIEYCQIKKGKWGFNRIIVDEVDTVNIPNAYYMHAGFYWFITNNVENVLFPNKNNASYNLRKIQEELSLNEMHEIARIIPKKSDGVRNMGFFRNLFFEMSTNNAWNYFRQIHRTFIRNIPSFVQESFLNEIPNMIHFNYFCKIPNAIMAIGNLLPANILVHLQAGNWEGAIHELQPVGNITATEEDFIAQITRELKRKCENESKIIQTLEEKIPRIRAVIERHEYNLENIRELLHGIQEEGGHGNEEYNQRRITRDEFHLEERQIQLANLEMRLNNHRIQYQTLNQQIENIQKRVQEDLSSSHCPVCLSTVGRPALAVPCCQHIFCMECLTYVFENSNKCPCCRTEGLTIEKCTVLEERFQKSLDATEESKEDKNNDFHFLNVDENTNEVEKNTEQDKQEFLKKLLHHLYQDENRRILIFFEYDYMFEKNIVPWLNMMNMDYQYLNGNSGTIGKRLDHFKDGTNRLLLLNARYFGVGLNLQMATDLIVFHRMVPAMERQIIGRAQRFGRTSRLNVHWLLYRGYEDVSTVF